MGIKLTNVISSENKNKIISDSSTMIMENALDPFTQILDDITSDESLNFSLSNFGPLPMMEAELLSIKVTIIISC